MDKFQMNPREQRMIIGLVPFLYDGKTFGFCLGRSSKDIMVSLIK